MKIPTEKEAERKLEEWRNDETNAANNLARFVRYRVKGGEKELRVMTAFVGRQKYYKEDAHGKEDEHDIETCFWEGLSDDDMFCYSHASRSSMASKKLDVATAGYLSYLLAEGLYETMVTEEHCSSKEYMKVYWENETLYLAFEGEAAICFPLPGKANLENLKEALGRIAWGRERFDAPEELLNSGDIGKIAESWFEQKEGALRLRSPLTCEVGGRGVCAACAGADPASRPYDRPAPMAVGSRVGLTAAQSIGERGAQLAMKRFHDTSNTTKKTPIEVLRFLLVQGRDDKGNQLDGENTSLRRFRLLIEKVLTDSEKNAASKELPQQLIHFELALKAPQGLNAWSSESVGRWLSAFAYSGTGALEKGDESETWGLKSSLMWDKAEDRKGGGGE